MNPLSRWFERRRVQREIADEMSEHLAEIIDGFRDEGYSEEEAALMARRQFGNITLHREDSRSAWGWNTLEQFSQDLRFAWRVLIKSPGHTATALIVLALGIGMNTAMFTAVKAVLLSALPYPEPDRIVTLHQTAKDGHLMQVSGPDFRDWRTQSRTVQDMSVYDSGGDSVTLSGSFAPRRARMGAVGSGFFDVMSTGAAIGRTFNRDEQRPGGPSTMVFGYELAAAVFGTPAAAIQKTVRLNGLAFTVIGVMPPGFDFPDHAQIWLPNDLFPDESSRSAHNYHVVGRLKPGVTVNQAQLDMNVVASRLAREYADDKDEGIRVNGLYEELVGSVRPSLLVLLGAVTLVLLIACVNISNLQLARGAARSKEMSMRRALGADRGRLVRQLLTENLLLAGAGGALGLALAEVAVRLLRLTALPNIPRIETLAIDSEILSFAAALSLAVGILFGMMPALNSSKADVTDALKQSSAKGETIPHKRWSGILVVCQISLAVLLLTGAALLTNSYWRLAHVATGLSTAGVYTTDVTWPSSPDGNSVDGAYVQKIGSQILRQIKMLPGIEAAGFIHGLPFQGAPDGSFEIDGRPLPADPHMYPDASYRLVTSEYFKAFALPVLQGRALTDGDQRSNQQVAIINQTFEKQFFPGSDAVGSRIRFLGFDRRPQWMTIIGVVPDVRANGLKRPVSPEVYAAYFQHPDTRMYATLVVRGPASLQPRIERIISSSNHFTAVHFESMDALISGTISRERFQTALLVLFGASAFLLALVGIYGLLSYTVTRRTSEIGVRMALGATRTKVVRLVLREGGTLLGVGLAIGLLASLLASRVLESMLYNVRPSDPSTLGVVIVAFAAAALGGCYLPARRASHIDPSEALRNE